MSLVIQLDQEMLNDALEGTSTGGNIVMGRTRVYMTSMMRDDMPPRLTLSTTPGYLDKGVRHA